MVLRHFRYWSLACVAALLMIGLLPAAAAVAQGVDAQINQHLAAGEFAPAVQLANQAPGPRRDGLLRQIAGAQAQAGVRRGAFTTAAQISSDLTRSQALGDVSGTPIGNFGGMGGGTEPDFESLINLITTTVEPESWEEVGGPGSIAEFETGVRVDAGGLVHALLREEIGNQLSELRLRAGRVSLDADVRQASNLRKVSLPKLEKHVQLKLAAGEPLDEDMLVLAGLEKIEYVLLYPQTGDLVLAGPAGDWQHDADGRIVNVDSGRPVLRLDDLVVILRHMQENYQAPFGCSIVPLKENLARTQAFLAESAKKPLAAGSRARNRWLSELRDELGKQAIEYYGIDPRTRVARVMFEADYHMKLIGIGLQEGTLGVPSYLESIEVPPGEAPPPFGVLRWWFTLNYQALNTTKNRDAFELRGPGAKVLSENELLTQQGERVHTGKSDVPTAKFAADFTQHFAKLAKKYPVYADLQNQFDLALACSLIAAEDLPSRVDWHLTCFGDDKQYQVQLGHEPKLVETVMNHRLVHRKHILAAVSGGVRVDPASVMKEAGLKIDATGTLSSKHDLFKPENIKPGAWWWD